MRSLLRSGVVLALLLAAPAAQDATAGASQVRGASTQVVLLQVLPAKHTLRVVNVHHAVRSYTFAGKLPTGAAPGSQLNFIVTGRRASQIQVSGRVNTISFYGRVVSVSSGGVMLRLGDGRPFVVRGVSATSAHRGKKHSRGNAAKPKQHWVQRRARTATARLAGLQPGDTVLVGVSSDSVGADGGSEGSTADQPQVVGPEAPGGGAGGSGAATGELAGQVVSVDPVAGQIVIQSADGVHHPLSVDQSLLDDADPQVCDIVNVAYHAVGAGAAADSIDVVDMSTDGACAVTDSAGAEDKTVDGSISAISADAMAFTLTTPAGPLRFSVDPDTLSGFSIGDAVTVSYATQDDGSLIADSVDPTDTSITTDLTGDTTDTTGDATSGATGG